MNSEIINGAVLDLRPEDAREQLSQMRGNVTYAQRAVNEGGLPVKYDVSWMALKVLSGSVPGGVRIIATVLPSPGDIFQNINLGVGVTAFRVFWHLGDGNFRSVDFSAPAGYYYPVISVIWRNGRVVLDEIVQPEVFPVRT